MAKSFFTLTLRKLFFVSLFLVVAASAGLATTSYSPSLTPPVHAAVTGLNGWAWSETIGWICFNHTTNCPSATVTVDASSNLNGYAWSENIGWIQFGGLAGFPTGGGTTAVNAKLQAGSIIGWAKAVAADNLGWDGWISLAGTGYGPTISGTTISGYAWGSDVVGWIDMSGISYITSNTPGCALSPAAQSLVAGSTANFTYTLVNSPTSATRSVDGGAAVAVSGGAFSVAGLALGSHTVTMNVTRSSDAATGTCGPASVTITSPVPVITISASPTSGAINTVNTTITWSVTNTPTSCTASNDWSGAKSTAGGSESMGVLTAERMYIYTLSCTNSGGTTSNGATVVVSTPIPSITSFLATPTRVRKGESSTLSWAVTNPPASCTITGTNGFNAMVSGASGSVPTNIINQVTDFTLRCGSAPASKATVTVIPQIQEI